MMLSKNSLLTMQRLVYQRIKRQVYRPIGLGTDRSIHDAARSSSASSSLASSSETMMSDSMILSIPAPYLREADVNNFDETTKQRKDLIVNMENGKPENQSVEEKRDRYTIRNCLRKNDIGNNDYCIEWADGVTSYYTQDWVEKTLAKWNQSYDPTVDRILWTNLDESQVRSSMSISFSDATSDHGMASALRTLYQYGILLVTDTPVDDGGCGVAALASAVSGGSIKALESTSLLPNYKNGKKPGIISLANGTDGPLRTLYGTVWSTVSTGQPEGSSVADSAYGQEALPLHTDMTYHRDPPGLQVFTMVQPAAKGGESVFADGFALANRLRDTYPDAFSVLSHVPRTYRCVDEATGWHLEARGPVIATCHHGSILAIRHNDLDRLPDLPPNYTTEVDSYYEKLWDAHSKWDDLLGQDEFRLEMALKRGDTVMVANQRCMHGRYSFQTSPESPRSIMGCYVSQDELNSRFRMEGLEV